MQIIIKNPTKAIISTYTQDEIEQLKKVLTYTNTSIQFQMSSWAKNIRMKRYKPDFWKQRYEELKSQLKECILKMDRDGSYFIRPGVIPHLGLENSVISNEISYPTLKSYNFINPLPFKLYDYQEQSIQKLINEKHGHVNLATGCGKSLILLNLTQRMGLKTAIIVPSKQIFNEIYELFSHHFGEKIVGKFGDGKKDIIKPITIAISKSLTMLEKGSKEYSFFENKEVSLFDESHLLPAETLEKVCHGVFQNVPIRLFCTGTAVRGDGKNIVLHSIIGKCVHELDTKTAIEQGYLCPLKFTIIKTYSPSTKKESDPIKAKRTHLLYNKVVIEKAAQIANASASVLNESTLILVEELRQISEIVKLLKVPYIYAHSASKKDAAEWGLEQVNVKDNLEKFNKGEAKVLIGTSCIDTGVNIYPTHNTINLVGGGSEITTKQGTIGRSVRKLENSKYKEFHKQKPFSKIYDFDIENVAILHKQYEKRLEWYEDTGCQVSII